MANGFALGGFGQGLNQGFGQMMQFQQVKQQQEHQAKLVELQQLQLELQRETNQQRRQEIAQEFALKQQQFGLDQQKFGFEQNRFGQTFGLDQQKFGVQQEQFNQEQQIRQATIDIARKKLSAEERDAGVKNYKESLKSLIDTVDKAPDIDRTNQFLDSMKQQGLFEKLEASAALYGQPGGVEQTLRARVGLKLTPEAEGTAAGEKEQAKTKVTGEPAPAVSSIKKDGKEIFREWNRQTGTWSVVGETPLREPNAMESIRQKVIKGEELSPGESELLRGNTIDIEFPGGGSLSIGGKGGMTAQNAKTAAELQKSTVATKQAIGAIQGVRHWSQTNGAAIMGTTGDVTRFVDALGVQIQAMTEQLGLPKAPAEVANGAYDFGRLSDAAAKSAVLKSRLIDLSYQVARAREPTGMLTKSDIQNALDTFGSVQSPKQLDAALTDYTERLLERYAIEQEVRTGKRVDRAAIRKEFVGDEPPPGATMPLGIPHYRIEGRRLEPVR